MARSRKIISDIYEAPFDKAKKAIELRGYEIISLEDNARLRIQEGKDSSASQDGNRTREGVIYVPNEGVFLTKNSPIMDNAEEATACHRNLEEFYLNDEQVEKSLMDAINISTKRIPANRLKDDEITVYVFGDVAEQYGMFLEETGIMEVSGRKEIAIDALQFVELQDRPFARQVYFAPIPNRSAISGYRDLTFGYSRVRWINKTEKGTAENFQVPKLIEKDLRKACLQGAKNLFQKLLRGS